MTLCCSCQPWSIQSFGNTLQQHRCIRVVANYQWSIILDHVEHRSGTREGNHIEYCTGVKINIRGESIFYVSLKAIKGGIIFKMHTCPPGLRPLLVRAF